MGGTSRREGEEEQEEAAEKRPIERERKRERERESGEGDAAAQFLKRNYIISRSLERRCFPPAIAAVRDAAPPPLGGMPK